MTVSALLLVASLVRAADPSVSLESRQGRCSVHGGFAVPASIAVVWDVLTDYDGIGAYVHSIESSRLERGPDGRPLLRQDATAEAWMVRRRVQVLLALEEAPLRRIGFHDVLGKDFREYVGAWTITAGERETQVGYDLVAEPTSAIGRMLCRGALRKTAGELLTEVRAEILRRSAEPGEPPGAK